MTVKPFTPEEAQKAKFVSVIPPEVITCVNEMIAKHLDSFGTATFKQSELVTTILARMSSEPDVDKRLYAEHWLDFEELYRDAGWRVEYDKPGYNESYAATFKFSKKKKYQSPLNSPFSPSHVEQD